MQPQNPDKVSVATPDVEQALGQINELMTKPMNHYNSARHENEIDMVAAVRERMVAVGLGDKLVECFDNNRFIMEAKDKPSHAQQYNLNRYFSTQFMAAKEEASIERYALIYEIRPDQWLEIFDKTILPSVVNCDLPVKL